MARLIRGLFFGLGLLRLMGSFGRMSLWFFFQAEDGIRDHCVTGVQTCALPISHSGGCNQKCAGSVPLRRLALFPWTQRLRFRHRKTRHGRQSTFATENLFATKTSALIESIARTGTSFRDS